MPNFKKFVIGSIIAIALCFLTITGLFIYNFGNYNLSSKIEHWGAFGDFIGGTLNIVISLVSLVVLGYITFLVSKESSEENRKQQLLIKRLEIYDLFYQSTIDIQHDGNQMLVLTDWMKITKNEEFKYKIQSDLFASSYRAVQAVKFIDNFKDRYGFYFSRSVKSDSYRELEKISRLYVRIFSALFDVIVLDKDEDEILLKQIDKGNYDKHINNFLNELRNEIEN